MTSLSIQSISEQAVLFHHHVPQASAHPQSKLLCEQSHMVKDLGVMELVTNGQSAEDEQDPGFLY